LQLWADPGVQDIMRKHEGRWVSILYRPWLARWSLPREEEARLEEALIDRHLAQLAESFRRAAGETNEVAGDLKDEARSESPVGDQALRKLLGETRFQALQEFERGGPEAEPEAVLVPEAGEVDRASETTAGTPGPGGS
jgi:hypothetical protein